MSEHVPGLSPPALLTAARLAVWKAIEDWEPLQWDAAAKTGFKTRWKFDDDRNSVKPDTPKMGDLPAISIFPAQSQSPWVTGCTKEFDYSLDVDLWLGQWQAWYLEHLYQQCVEALFQSPASSGSTHILDVCGKHPDVDVFSWRFEDPGGGRALVLSFQVRVQIAFRPTVSVLV